jgi:quinol monooxygenase YgiN
MLIIAGHVTVAPERRDAYVAAFAEMLQRARSTPGCLDIAITADPLAPDRVNNFERWESDSALQAWREVASPPDTGVHILENHVRLWDASNERSPFS